jgi:hypothetical protein
VVPRHDRRDANIGSVADLIQTATASCGKNRFTQVTSGFGWRHHVFGCIGPRSGAGATSQMALGCPTMMGTSCPL